MHLLRPLPLMLAAACVQQSAPSVASRPLPINLTITNNCPTDITLDMQGATPGGTVVFYSADDVGSTVIQNGTCTGRTLPIGPVANRIGTTTVNANGALSGDFPAPPGVCGQAVVALDLTTCEVSNVAQVRGGPPTEPFAAIDTLSPACDPVVCLLNAPSSDPDNDPIFYSTSWLLDGLPYTGPVESTNFAGDTIPEGVAEPGSTWSCAFTASDGANSTRGPWSSTIVVQDTPDTAEFVMPDRRPQVDFLLVVDDSGSMGTYQNRLQDSMGTVASTLLDVESVGRVGVVTTDMLDPARRGRLTEFDGFRFLTENSPDFEQRLVGLTTVGTLGSATEQGIDAAAAAMSRPLSQTYNAGFKRANADLAMVVLTDEDDASLLTPSDFSSTIVRLEDRSGLDINLYAIAAEPGTCDFFGQSPPTRYLEVIAQIGGDIFSICDTDYGPSLDRIVRDATGEPRSFDLGFTPNIAELTVQLTPRAGSTINLGPSDYELDGTTITLNLAPPAGWTLFVSSIRECTPPPPIGDTDPPQDTGGPISTPNPFDTF